MMKPLKKISVLVLLAASIASCSEQPGDEQSAASQDSDSGDNARIVLVTGATGTQGGAVARELLSRGYAVRGLTRNPKSDRARALEKEGATMVRGDFADAESLAVAMRDVYGVFAMTDFWEHGYETEVAHGKQLVDQAAAASIQHFVYTSVAGAHQNTGIPHFDSKFEVEQYLSASGVPHTIVRPVSFMDNWRYAKEAFMSGEYADPRDSDSRHQWIASSDIGFFVGEAFDEPQDWLGRSLDIAGDEMTLGQFLDLVSERLGQPMVYQQVGWEEYTQEAGEEMAIMTRWFQEKGYSADVTGLRERYPNLTSASDYLGQLEWDKP